MATLGLLCPEASLANVDNNKSRFMCNWRKQYDDVSKHLEYVWKTQLLSHNNLELSRA